MAIDDREKRQSVVAVSFYYYAPSVTPNSSKDQEWRQQAGYGYSGIAVGEPSAADTIAVWLKNRRIIMGQI